MNDNGERLTDLISNNYYLAVGGAFYQQQDICNYTWVSPNCRDTSQPDRPHSDKKEDEKKVEVLHFRRVYYELTM